MTGGPTGPPAEHERWLRDGTELLTRTAAGVADLTAPSALPSWTGRHLLTHVARNADALGNLLAWARTGTQTPMYASAEQRDDDIEAGARRADSAVRADLAASTARLDAALAAMTPAAWRAQVRTARGREVRATEVVWMRIREVWVHSIDLGGRAGLDGRTHLDGRVGRGSGVSAGDFPPALVAGLLTDAAAAIGARPGCPSVLLAAPGRSWPLGAGPGAQLIAGEPPELLAWLIGRDPGRPLHADGPLPAMPAWL